MLFLCFDLGGANYLEIVTQSVGRDVGDVMGYKRVVVKGDQEPAIVSLREAVYLQKGIEVMKEESPVGEHQSNGRIENTIRQIQGVFRSMKDALESRYGKRLEGDSWAIPWLRKHVGAMMNRLHIQPENGI